MRALEPDHTGHVTRNGIRSYYEVFGSGERTILLLPTWSIVHSRAWKMQVPYLARYFRVVTFDGRGNGQSDRPADKNAYAEQEYADDARAVLDETHTDSAVIVGWSMGAQRGLLLATQHPERIAGVVFIAPAIPLPDTPTVRGGKGTFLEPPPDNPRGWEKFNRQYWLENYRDFLEFFMSQALNEAHSTKHREDCVGWGLETTPETLVATEMGPALADDEAVRELATKIRCPAVVLHGDNDAVRPHASGARLAEYMGADFVTLEGCGHAPNARHPVKVNRLLRDFAEPTRQYPKRWARGPSRRKRALYISSPIGLGHAQRDVAIAKALREQVPDLEIDWLAQDPVTRVLEAEGERIHPASALLASESRHIESESAEHDLHCFQAFRRMDEIMVSNFMVFHDLIEEEHYDLWIGDEAWELDYYLHENPEEKRAAYAWLTDFVGFLPMAEGGEHEAFLTADYNAEMIEHIARYPRLRDRALFVGEEEHVVPESFGPDLPMIRDWTREHYLFPGYVTGFNPADYTDIAALRAELGYGEDEQVCIVTVGGSGVGASLLKRVIEAYPAARSQVPALRMIVVAGPRIDPESLPQHKGLEIRPYVHNLYRHLAACDLAVVQGGLTTAMELTANRRPFLYFPLKHHFEQQVHVHHRLQCYGAGRRMDFEAATPELIAQAISEEIGRDVHYQPVDPGGAHRAARLIAEML